MFANYRPDQVVPVISYIGQSALRAAGITVLAITLDNTLRKSGRTKISDRFAAKLDMLRASGFTIVLISDRMSDSKALEDRFQCKVLGTFRSSRRQRRFLLHSIGENLKVKDRSKIAVIGNSLQRDIAPAKRLGMYTILVTPLGPDSAELHYRPPNRRLEALILRFMKIRQSPIPHLYAQ
jgi:HAD superfamily phosphatase (TIGR01668 family)